MFAHTSAVFDNDFFFLFLRKK